QEWVEKEGNRVLGRYLNTTWPQMMNEVHKESSIKAEFTQKGDRYVAIGLKLFQGVDNKGHYQVILKMKNGEWMRYDMGRSEVVKEEHVMKMMDERKEEYDVKIEESSNQTNRKVRHLVGMVYQKVEETNCEWCADGTCGKTAETTPCQLESRRKFREVENRKKCQMRGLKQVTLWIPEKNNAFPVGGMWQLLDEEEEGNMVSFIAEPQQMQTSSTQQTPASGTPEPSKKAIAKFKLLRRKKRAKKTAAKKQKKINKKKKTASPSTPVKPAPTPIPGAMQSTSTPTGVAATPTYEVQQSSPPQQQSTTANAPQSTTANAPQPQQVQGCMGSTTTTAVPSVVNNTKAPEVKTNDENKTNKPKLRRLRESRETSADGEIFRSNDGWLEYYLKTKWVRICNEKGSWLKWRNFNLSKTRADQYGRLYLYLMEGGDKIVPAWYDKGKDERPLVRSHYDTAHQKREPIPDQNDEENDNNLEKGGSTVIKPRVHPGTTNENINDNNDMMLNFFYSMQKFMNEMKDGIKTLTAQQITTTTEKDKQNNVDAPGGAQNNNNEADQTEKSSKCTEQQQEKENNQTNVNNNQKGVSALMSNAGDSISL
ncbi:hypothetical protein, partial [Chryseobacterium sp.]|uniref:hypothetical protein n=1 Tax=Chryseobacterium sp. TaxID=1871047 RepID=UPI0032196845